MPEPLDYSKIFRFHLHRVLRKNRPEPDRYFIVGKGADQTKPPQEPNPVILNRMKVTPSLKRENSLAWSESGSKPLQERKQEIGDDPARAKLN